MPRPLTKAMRHALRDAVRGEIGSVTKTTLRGLSARGLTDQLGVPTHEGWKLAVTMMPLNEQCERMGIEYGALEDLEKSNFPEYAAWKYFNSLGYEGGFCEGGPVLLLIRAAALEVLTELNTFQSRQDACYRFTEAQLTIHEEHSQVILEAIRSAGESEIILGFEEIYTSLLVQEEYPGLTAAAMASLFNALGANGLAQITEAILEAPYTYRAGWPDLTMVNENEMLWAEVKTTDKLHMSQITTLQRMKPLLPGSLRVVQLV